MKVKVNDQKDTRAKKARMYFFHENENVMETFFNRRARSVKDYRAMMPEILKNLTQDFDAETLATLRFRWSQNAGCSCGCSPGFIIDGIYGKEVFVTIGGEDA